MIDKHLIVKWNPFTSFHPDAPNTIIHHCEVLRKTDAKGNASVWWGKISKSGNLHLEHSLIQSINNEISANNQFCILFIYCPYGDQPSLHVGKISRISENTNIDEPNVPEYYKNVGLPVSIWFNISDLAEISVSEIENLAFLDGRDYDPVETNPYPIIVCQKNPRNFFITPNRYREVLDRRKDYRSAFISYGGPDEEIAGHLNSWLKARGVKTWFFPEDSIPGEKLHRTMSSGVSEFDRVILLCSKNSLDRPGVLNELERVFAREAKEGGSDILIPVAIDDFVFNDWTPERRDIAEKIRERVITKLTLGVISGAEKNLSLRKILSALEM